MENCEFVRLGDIVNIKTGKLDANASSPNGKYPFFTCAKEPLRINSYSYDCECVLVAGNGDLNVKYFHGKFDAYQRTYIIESKNDNLYMPYLYYFLDNYVEILRKKSIGGIIKYIKLNNLTDIKFPLPKKQKQIEISNILSKSKDTINNLQTRIQKYDELVKSQFIEMFGDISLSPQLDNWRELADIGEIVGGSTPKTDNKEFWNGNLNWFTPAEISENDFYVFESERKITDKGAQSCSLKKMPINTVILSSRAPIGKVAIAGEEFYCNQGFKNIICGEQINHIYLYTLLKNNNDYLNSLGRGATFKEISKSIVSKIRIPVPTIDRQNQFADFVKHIDKLKFTLKQTLEKLENCYHSLMQEYFE